MEPIIFILLGVVLLIVLKLFQSVFNALAFIVRPKEILFITITVFGLFLLTKL